LINAPKPPLIFHSQTIRTLFDDKLKTYSKFPRYTIPTVKIGHLTKTNIKKARNILRSICNKHPYREDFNSVMVLKDQFGIGGNNIFKITSNLAGAPLGSSIYFLLQPFIKNSGFNITQCTESSDLRVIICDNTIVQSYIRVAKKREFRANAQQGGKVVYLNLKQIPNDVLAMIEKIKKGLPKKINLCALDFIRSNSGHLYFVEGNTNPGLIWFDKSDEKKAKQLMRLIVKKLKKLYNDE
jgi:glutathione synthase/RimK-type ligase-like ATP-grasp enzyme